MADVKWIKITTDMFEDEKIDFIISLPESDAILVIWIRLLALAGKCNAGGYIYLTEKIPYTEDMLSHKFRKPPNIVKLALETFKKLGMMDFDENGIFLSNWDKHQNVEGMEKIKEQTRIRTNRYREKLKQLPHCDATCDATVTVGDAIELDKELDIDIDIDISSSRTNKFADDSPELSLASELFNLILGNNQKAKQPNLQTWAKGFDLIVRVDKQSVEDVRKVMTWSQKDSFWQGNILSPMALRKQFDKLVVQMKTRGDKVTKGPSTNLPKVPKNKYDGFYL